MSRWGVIPNRRVVPILLFASFVLTACGSKGVSIVSVHVAPDDTKLMATVDACDDKARVAVESSSGQVSLSASVPRKLSTSGSDCLTEVLVPLGEPLAGRVVVDSSTDKEVPVGPADGHENWG